MIVYNIRQQIDQKVDLLRQSECGR